MKTTGETIQSRTSHQNDEQNKSGGFQKNYRPENERLKQLKKALLRNNSVKQLTKQEECRAIQTKLNTFINQWTPERIAANVGNAFDSLAGYLALVGIVYQDNSGSRERNPNVRGLYIGEIVDMLNTLHTFRNQDGFIPDKFWSKIMTMSEIMGEEAEE